MTYADALLLAAEPEALGVALDLAAKREGLWRVRERERIDKGQLTDFEKYQRGLDIEDK